jgi:hypothetical protein
MLAMFNCVARGQSAYLSEDYYAFENAAQADILLVFQFRPLAV